MNLQRQTSNHYYGWSGIPNQWTNDNDRSYHDKFFDDKNYEDFYFDNFYDMDEMFGHKNSLFGTRGLPVGHPNRSSKSFDTYNKKFGPMIVRVIKNNDLQESIKKILRETVDKSEDKKLKLVTKMIHEFFDEVSFIDIKKYENKPMIRVYFDNDEEAANEETYFAEQIQDKIYEYTGIKLIPYWHNIQDNTDSYFRLDAIKLKYDSEGNVINESEEKQPKYLNIIKELIEPFKKEDCVCDIRVTFKDDMYMIYLVFGTEELNDLFFSFVGRADYGRNLRNDVKNAIKGYLPIDNLYVGSISKPNCKWKPMNESEKKKQSLTELIDQYGLYDFIKMSGLDISQISSVLKNMDNPKEILKQYIRKFVLERDGSRGENSGSLFALQIPLSNTKYVEDILVHDEDYIGVEIWEYHLDEYGHREQKDQYLTTINNLTNEELLSIVAWMMETIKNGDWD